VRRRVQWDPASSPVVYTYQITIIISSPVVPTYKIIIIVQYGRPRMSTTSSGRGATSKNARRGVATERGRTGG
jgi:hypothetical protein